MGNTVKSAFDSVRAAPLGSSLAVLGMVPGGIALIENGPHLSDIAVLAFGSPSVAGGIALAAIQIKFKKRLEGIISRRGYSDEIMAPTTRTWCNRQTGRVVCANAGYLEEYIDLCERTKEYNALSCLPHF